jgi:hypothetical protein
MNYKTETLNGAIKFSIVRDKVSFAIGVQSFLLDYEPEDEQHFIFMADMLTKAISRVVPVSDDEEYELHQNDEWVAGASGKNALSEIMNYARQYSQDGPVEIFKVTRTKINPDPLGIRAALQDDINEMLGPSQ